MMICYKNKWYRVIRGFKKAALVASGEERFFVLWRHVEKYKQVKEPSRDINQIWRSPNEDRLRMV